MNLRLPSPSFKLVGPKISPPTPSLNEGVYAPNDYLHRIKRHFEGALQGVESIAECSDGSLYLPDKFGHVWKSKGPANANLELLAHLGAGRPLGCELDRSGNLVICNAGTGLQMLEKDTLKVVLLASEAPTDQPPAMRSPILYANDLAIAEDGSVYFSDSTDIPPARNATGFYDTMASFMLTLFQGEASGRVLKYDSTTQLVTIIADGFWYSNGVALSEDETFLLVVETCLSRVIRIWLRGEKAGLQEVFYEKPPGYPDNISRGGNGTFWIGLVAPSQPVLENVILPSRILRWIAAWLPISWKPKPKSGGGIVQVDAEGNVMRYLSDLDGSHISTTSSVTATADGLWLGNLGGDFVAFLRHDDLPPCLRHGKQI